MIGTSGNKKEHKMKEESKKIFIEIANEVGGLVQQKNEAYGNSFAKSQDIVKILFPDGVRPDQYRDMLAVTRVIDKLFRIATNKDAFGESPWRDICGYAILGIANDEGDKRQRQAARAKVYKTKTNAELWDEQHEDPRVNTVDTVKVIPPEIVRQLVVKATANLPSTPIPEAIKKHTNYHQVVQKVRDRKEEGHDNPYANIDESEKRDRRFSYDNTKKDVNISAKPTALLELFPNLNDILVRLEKEESEGNKEKDAQSLEHWSNRVAGADTGNIPSE
jgi:hypothetical protein